MSMDIYFRISHKIKYQEGRKIRKTKMLMDSQKPKTRNEKQERLWDQRSTKECKPIIGMRSSKKIRQLAKKPDEHSKAR